MSSTIQLVQLQRWGQRVEMGEQWQMALALLSEIREAELEPDAIIIPSVLGQSAWATLFLGLQRRRHCLRVPVSSGSPRRRRDRLRQTGLPRDLK
eukprot:2199424-Pyramimonas_sp.AAC.1